MRVPASADTTYMIGAVAIVNTFPLLLVFASSPLLSEYSAFGDSGNQNACVPDAGLLCWLFHMS